MIFIFCIVAGLQCSVNFLRYSKVTQLYIHVYILNYFENFLFLESNFIYKFTATSILANIKSSTFGVPVMAQQKQIRLGIMRLRVQSLASLSGLRIRRCCELWPRPAATAPIRPMAGESPYAVVAALKNQNKTKSEG